MAMVNRNSDHPGMHGLTPLVSRLRLRHLQLLQALVELGSLRAAAKQLALPQPIVGKMLRDMEHAFGTPLFDRSPNGVQACSATIPFSQRAVVALEALRAALGELTTTAHPTLRIGILTIAMTARGAAWLQAMRRAAPTIRLDVRIGSASDLVTRLLRGEIDCAIARVPIGEAADQVHERCQIWQLPVDPCHVVARKEHPATRRRKPLSAEELALAEWVLPAPGAQLRQRLHEACALAAIPIPRPVITADAMQSCLFIAADANYLTLCSESLLRQDLFGRKLRIVKTPLVIQEPSTALLYLKESSLLSGLNAFRQAVVPTG